jgi:hypothetical protein
MSLPIYIVLTSYRKVLKIKYFFTSQYMYITVIDKACSFPTGRLTPAQKSMQVGRCNDKDGFYGYMDMVKSFVQIQNI